MDKLDKLKILEDLKIKIEIEIRDEITSTNKVLKEIASNKESYILIANKQTEGVGRFKKQFYSPSRGIYLSHLYRPNNLDPKDSYKYTILSAISAVKSIKEVLNIDTKIKWLNDIYLDNKKIAGILTEASINVENNLVDFIIIGIGINIYKPEFIPEELKNLLGYLKEKEEENLRNKIIRSYINNFYYLLNKDYINEYKKYNLTIGKNILVKRDNIEYVAKAIGIDQNCNLVVEVNNKLETLKFHEVSIKIL